MRRGEIVWVDLDPVRGSQSSKRRPAVIVSNDGANAMADRLGRGVLTVVPVTTNVTRILPFHVFLPADECSLAEDSKAQAEQVRSVDVQRIVGRAGEVPPRILAQVDDALRLHLGL